MVAITLTMMAAFNWYSISRSSRKDKLSTSTKRPKSLRRMARDGKELDKDNKVEILAEYDGDDTKPKSLRATSIVDGVRQQPQHYDN